MDAKVSVQDLAKALAAHNDIGESNSSFFLQSFFEVILNSLKQDKYVKIKGLGTFKQIEVESRESMNIHTGERFEIQGHMKISFTPDNSLKNRVNKPFAHFETVVLNEGVTDEDLEEVDERFLNQETAQETAVVVPQLVESDEENISESVSESKIEEEMTPESTSLQEENIEAETERVCLQEENQKADSVVEIEVAPVQTEEHLCQEEAEDEKAQVLDECKQENEGCDDSEDEENDIEEIDAMEREKKKYSKYYILLTMVLALLALCIGYAMGAFLQKPKEIQVVLYDTVYIEKKTVVRDTVVIEKESAQKKAETTLSKKEEKATTSEKQPTKVTDRSKYPQLPGGAYWIIGTAQTYKLRAGETIRVIAERFFGSRQMAHYIIKYNGISDPDHVAEGTVLKIPKLEIKRK